MTRSPWGAFALEQTELDWAYMTEPQKHLNSRVLRQVNGRVLGGGSILNHGTWIRGAAAEYDQWAKNVDDERWSYRGMLPYFKRCENHFQPSDASGAHGYGGPISTYSVSASDPERTYGLREQVKTAFTELGVSLADDDDGSTHPGLSEMVENWKDGVRQPSNLAYNLDGVEVITEVLVQKVVTKSTPDGNIQATGIKLANGSEISATREVIVCTGAYRSPQLLMLSGIGPSNSLAAHKIPQVLSLEGVGMNLFDHISIWQWWHLRNPEAGLAMGHSSWKDRPAFKKGMPGDWVLSEAIPTESLSRTLTIDGHGTNHPLLDDVERVHFQTIVAYAPAGADKVGLKLPADGSYIATSTLNTVPTARGTVNIRSAIAEDSPVIDPNFVSTATDRASLRHGVRKVIRAMLGTKAGQDMVKEEVPPPGCTKLNMYTSDEELDQRIAQTAVNYKHASGTCAMGKVVDSECRVFGVKGLRIVDASILPNPTAGWPQACLYAVAEQAADMILGKSLR